MVLLKRYAQGGHLAERVGLCQQTDILLKFNDLHSDQLKRFVPAFRTNRNGSSWHSWVPAEGREHGMTRSREHDGLREAVGPLAPHRESAGTLSDGTAPNATFAAASSRSLVWLNQRSPDLENC